ncbi:hypothetical protein P8C59_009458 [Phyllachora maydis]|uniref:Steroid 5-alpha reductase C-terminal domain-containing protein n=1 Tax=Phyllachora maydis TaxID=1825666 RepID=A0AAD9IDR6_9PEZI|nr:hypothetical protein P8C59_009458 [Phyllachora maydis]
MTLLQSLLRLTNFQSPLLRTLVPSVSAAFAIQAAFAVPSVAARSERFYDFSGSLTYLAVTTLSLYLPAIRARHAAGLTASHTSLPSLLAPFTGPSALHWRQVVLSGAVALWATRLGLYLFQRVLQDGSDSRFAAIKTSPPRFLAAFTAQAVWVSACLLPVVAVNAVPPAALAARGPARPVEALGLALFAAGLALEVAADRQRARWVRDRRNKLHDDAFLTRGLWSRSRHPNYFGESTLWTGIATAAAGVLLARPAQLALGLGPFGTLCLCYASPAFVTFLLLKVSGVPLSENKYDGLYGHRQDYQEWKRNTPMYIPKLF